MDRKGYYFIIDSIIALFIITVGIIYVLSFSISEPPTRQSEIFSFDIIQFLATTKIEEIDNPYSGKLGQLVNDGNITEIKNTILQQTAEFHFRAKKKGCDYCTGGVDSVSYKFIDGIFEDLIAPQFNYNISIEGELIYERKIESKVPRLFIPKRRLVVGIYNQEEIYGPYLAEVMLWQ